MGVAKAVQITLLVAIVAVLVISFAYIYSIGNFASREYQNLKKSMIPSIAEGSYQKISYRKVNQFKVTEIELETLQDACSALMSVYNTSMNQDPQLPTYMRRVGVLERHGFIFDTPGAVLIVYRGTINSRDLLSDFLASQTSFVDSSGTVHEKLRVHRGFHDIWLGGMKDRRQFYQDIRRSNRPIILIGHSLGGALATFEALSLRLAGYRGTIKLVTFASPKIGNWEFLSELESKNIDLNIIKNKNDLIPSLPPPVLSFAGETWTYSDFDEHIVIDSQKYSIRENHSIYSYLEGLKSAKREIKVRKFLSSRAADRNGREKMALNV